VTNYELKHTTGNADFDRQWGTTGEYFSILNSSFVIRNSYLRLIEKQKTGRALPFSAPLFGATLKKDLIHGWCLIILPYVSIRHS